jgi:hypothetical protein
MPAVRRFLTTAGPFAAAALSPFAAHAQSCPDPAALTRGHDLPLAAVRYLADDALMGRLAGSPGERCAGDYIASVFRKLQLRPAGEDGTYFQSLPVASALNPHGPDGTGRNVIAALEGRDPVLRDEWVVIGAHYDHLGEGGGSNSTAPGQRAVHNGADDNASGVSALLHIAERLSTGDRPARSVLFIAFTAEEGGLLGSDYFVTHPTIGPDTMVAMLNMDMVGRLGAGPLIVYGVDTAEEWRGLLNPAVERAGVALTVHGEGYGPSDHTSFYKKDIPVLHFFTNVHSDYHNPGDDWEKIDAPGLEKVAAIVTEVAMNVANRRPVLTLVRGAGTPPAPAGEGAGRGYGTYLGSIPDFTPVERGVRLSGVTPGSPADRAGLRAGDIILGLGAHDVADLQGLTDALRAHRPGDDVVVRFQRDGELRRVDITLGSRAR